MLAILTLHLHHLMICSQGLKHLFLNGGVLRHLLIHHLERDEIHRIRHIRAVFHTRVEIQQAIVGIEASEQELHTELLHPDMLDGTPVVLIDGLHHQFDEYGRLVTEFLEIDVGTVGKATLI